MLESLLSLIARSPGARSGVACVAGRDSRAAIVCAPVLVWLAVLAWVITTAATSTGQWGDHFEQFVWSHGIEWGYHKHPPLPTWILGAATRLFGPSALWPYVLATCCAVGTAMFTYGIARTLFGREIAALALLLLSLSHAFSARACLFNHNSVMLLTVSGTAWCVLQALSSHRALVWWAFAGAGAALAVLSKYQAVVPLAGIVVGAWLAGDLARRQSRHGLFLAFLVALALLTPHLLWLGDGHSTPLENAAQQGRALAGTDRAWNVFGFLAQQLRFLLGPVVFVGLLVLLPGERGRQPDADVRRCRAWLVGLVAFPLGVTVLTGPLFGIQLQNHWGYQALQFVALWLAWRLRPLAPVAGAGWLLAALALHAAFLAIALSSADLALGKGKARLDMRYPAQALADAVLRDWRNDTLCPLALVVGPSFEAGMISVYSGGQARVLEDGDFRKSPWIDPGDPRRLGAVYVATDPASLPRVGVSTTDSMGVHAVTPAGKDRIYWAIVPPEQCIAGVSGPQGK